MPYKDIKPPAGEKIIRGQNLNVPDRPVIPFIRGDGTGPDIWAASERVFDAASRRLTAAKRKSRGLKFLPARQRKTNSIPGFPTTR
jgi:Isocitrate dehydrogenases